VSAVETGDKVLKKAKAFCFGWIIDFSFTDDVQTADAVLDWNDTSSESRGKGGDGKFRPLAK
jgi:hypothetical protein